MKKKVPTFTATYRLPPEVINGIAKVAKKHDCSINSAVVVLLRNAIAAEQK